MLSRIFFLVLIFVCFGYQANAEKRVALVIGNSTYLTAGKLSNPRNDAIDVADVLRRLEFSVTLGLDLNQSSFERTISTFARTADGADVSLIYYTGHGIGLGRETYFLPIDAAFQNEFEAKRQTIGLSEILGTLNGRSKMVLAFVDACRDNPLAERLAAQSYSEGRSTVVTRGLARIDVSGTDTLVVYATSAGRTAADGIGRNSPFTTAFLANVETMGIEVETMLKRVSAHVMQYSNKTQEPERFSKLRGEFYFKATSDAVNSSKQNAKEVNLSVNEVVRPDSLIDARQLIEKKEYQNAKLILEQLAEQGDALATVKLGELFQYGDLGYRDDRQALKYYLIASNKGSPKAWGHLGDAYADGAGVEKSVSEAFLWFERAAKQGNPWSALRLGLAYRDGLGATKNASQAVKWFQTAADAGIADGHSYLAALYRRGELVKADPEASLRHLMQAAMLGHENAQYRLATAYSSGVGTTQDPREAYKWAALSARAREPEPIRLRDRLATQIPSNVIASINRDVEVLAKEIDQRSNVARTKLEEWSWSR